MYLHFFLILKSLTLFYFANCALLKKKKEWETNGQNTSVKLAIPSQRKLEKRKERLNYLVNL